METGAVAGWPAAMNWVTLDSTQLHEFRVRRVVHFVWPAISHETFNPRPSLVLLLATREGSSGEMTANDQGDRTAVPLSNFDACRQNSNHCDCIVTGLPAAVDHSDREAASPTLKAPINPFL